VPDGVGEIAESISSAANAAESAAEGVGQAASSLAEVGASDAANNLAASVDAIAEVQGPQAALESLAGDSPFSVDGASVEGSSDAVGAESAGESIVDGAQAGESVEGGDVTTQPEGDGSQIQEEATESQSEADEGTQGDEGEEAGDESGEGDANSEAEALTAENDALRKENEELKAELAAYDNIRQILENLDLSALDSNSEQSQEQKQKSLGLILAALQLMLAFFNTVSKGQENRKTQSSNKGPNPPPRNPQGGGQPLPNREPIKIENFRKTAPIPAPVNKAA